MKKLLLVFTLILSLTCIQTPAFAITTQNVDESGTAVIDVEVTREAATFSVTVPTSLPIHITSSGAITTADSCKIINNSAAPVMITQIEVQSGEGWRLIPFTQTPSTIINTKEVAWQMVVGGETVGTTTTGTQETLITNTKPYAGGMTVGKGGEITVTYSAKVPPRSQNILSDTSIASVIFTLGWNA